jgi:CheY-like chemotaxis protein
MEPQVALRAFDPFFTTKPQGKGTGLGLSQVYGVAKQSGGGVLLASVPAEGTTVTVFLPRSYQAPATAHDEVPAPDRLPNSTVLVVDDDPLVRETVVGAVAVLGCQPDSVPDGGAALRRIEDGPVPDVIVLDFAMPGLNGADAARAIRALRPDVPIIFMTGHADPTPLTDERWILVKPFRTSQLARVLAEALGVTPA